VSTQYEKWVNCVWLSEHMSMLERSRLHELYAVKRIDPRDAEVYRRSLKCVFDSFLEVYATIRSDRYSRAFRCGKKTMLLMIAGPGCVQMTIHTDFVKILKTECPDAFIDSLMP
jgi:hypothetical protein